MKIVLLSSGTEADSTKKLIDAAQKLGHQVQLFHPFSLSMELGKTAKLYHGKKSLTGFDLVIPRLGWLTLNHGLRVLEHFEVMNVRSLNSAEAIRRTSDKWLSLQILKKHKIPVLNSIMNHQSSPSEETAYRYKKSVVKLMHGSQGFGVARGNSLPENLALVDVLRNSSSEHFVQEYSAISKGQDIRVLVFKGEVLASMKRTPGKGEFRSNLHRGGKASAHRLSPQETKMALKAVQCLGLEFAGVDLIKSKEGTAVLEVNAFPGLEGIERISKINISEIIIKNL